MRCGKAAGAHFVSFRFVLIVYYDMIARFLNDIVVYQQTWIHTSFVKQKRARGEPKNMIQSEWGFGKLIRVFP